MCQFHYIYRMQIANRYLFYFSLHSFCSPDSINFVLFNIFFELFKARINNENKRLENKVYKQKQILLTTIFMKITFFTVHCIH